MNRPIVALIAAMVCVILSAPVIAQTSPPKDKADQMLDEILKNVRPQKPAPSAGSSNDARPTGGAAVRETIRPCWNSFGLKTQANVPIVVQMGRDARPVRAEPRDKVKYENDVDYRAAADAALRAVLNPRCQPWPLPLDKYESWQVITLNFDSRH